MARTKLTSRRDWSRRYGGEEVSVIIRAGRHIFPGCICRKSLSPVIGPSDRVTRSMTAAMAPILESAPIQASSPPKPVRFEAACKNIFKFDKPIQSSVGNKLFCIGELVEIIAKDLDPHDIVRLSRINHTWYGMARDPAKDIRSVYGSESDHDILDSTTFLDANGIYKEGMDITLNSLIFHPPGDYGQRCGYLRSSPTESLGGHGDPRPNVFICDPPVNEVTVEFELYYTAAPTVQTPARVITICGSRRIRVAGGVRYKHVQRAFQEESNKHEGQQVLVDILRSYVKIPNVKIHGVPEIAKSEAKAQGVEIVQMPDKTSYGGYKVFADGKEISSKRGEDGEWADDIGATEDDE